MAVFLRTLKIKMTNTQHRPDSRFSEIPYEQTLVFGNMAGSVFYKTPQWKRARYVALTTHGNRCQLCGAGPATGPLHVDHIKPRSLFPERCLDPTNLQVLCEDCHTAKGVLYLDDLRSSHTKIPARQMADFLRIERKHLLLADRAPTSAEARLLGEGVRAATKNHRKRWRLMVKFCGIAKISYPQAARVTVQEFLLTPWISNHSFQKFLQNGGDGPKQADDLFFDVDGCPFPVNLHSLLADDQRITSLKAA